MPPDEAWRAYAIVPVGASPRLNEPTDFDRVRSGMTLGELVAVLGRGQIASGPNYHSGCGIIDWACADGRRLSVWPVTSQAGRSSGWAAAAAGSAGCG